MCLGPVGCRVRNLAAWAARFGDSAQPSLKRSHGQRNLPSLQASSSWVPRKVLPATSHLDGLIACHWAQLCGHQLKISVDYHRSATTTAAALARLHLPKEAVSSLQSVYNNLRLAYNYTRPHHLFKLYFTLKEQQKYKNYTVASPIPWRSHLQLNYYSDSAPEASKHTWINLLRLNKGWHYPTHSHPHPTSLPADAHQTQYNRKTTTLRSTSRLSVLKVLGGRTAE